MTYQQSNYGSSNDNGQQEWTGPQADKLRAAGWLAMAGDGCVFLKPADSMPDVAYARVLLNEDGTLHLMTQRSDFHRKLAGIVA